MRSTLCATQSRQRNLPRTALRRGPERLEAEGEEDGDAAGAEEAHVGVGDRVAPDVVEVDRSRHGREAHEDVDGGPVRLVNLAASPLLLPPRLDR